MTDFQQQALQLASQQSGTDWLADLRARGADRWAAAVWPTRKTEAWKYTPLLPLQNDNPARWASVDDCAWQQAIDPIPVDATRLVFVNGHFRPEHSSALPAGVARFSEADAAQRELIRSQLGTVMDSSLHLFGALSDALAADGVLIHVPRNQTLDKPVYILNVSTPEAQPAMSSQRVLVVLEDNAEAELIEHYVSGDEKQNLFVTAMTEVVVGNNARMQHYRINLEQEDLLHVGGVHVDLHRDARFLGFALGQGSRLKRIDYHVNHCGQGAHLGLNGVYLPRNRQLIDYHTNVEHKVAHCTTDEVFRGIIGDSAKAVFNGRIHIHQDAQKTLAEMSNRNLLTSPNAEVNTKPELEIYADDVRCGHGATIAQLDETSIFYLQSRGVTRSEAVRMLSFGFINELLNEVPGQAIQDYLRPRLTALFGQADEKLGQMTYE